MRIYNHLFTGTFKREPKPKVGAAEYKRFDPAKHPRGEGGRFGEGSGGGSSDKHGGLSTEALEFLDKWSWDNVPPSLTQSVMDELSRFKPIKPIKVYRGLPKSAMDNFAFQHKPIISYSHARGYAEAIANIGENEDITKPQGVVFEDTVPPKHVIVDITMIPGWEDRWTDEVIVKAPPRGTPFKGRLIYSWTKR